MVHGLRRPRCMHSAPRRLQQLCSRGLRPELRTDVVAGGGMPSVFPCHKAALSKAHIVLSAGSDPVLCRTGCRLRRAHVREMVCNAARVDCLSKVQHKLAVAASNLVRFAGM